jgi:hypothetical protein
MDPVATAIVEFEHHLLPLASALLAEDLEKLTLLTAFQISAACGSHIIVRYFGSQNSVNLITASVIVAQISDSDLNSELERVMETSLAAIRLIADRDAMPIYFQDGFITVSHRSFEATPTLKLGIQTGVREDYVMQIENVCKAFAIFDSNELRVLASLIAESQVPTIPAHYRALSLVRAIELIYRDEIERKGALDNFEESFSSLKISNRKFKNALPEIRAKCAHGEGSTRTRSHSYRGICYNRLEIHSLIKILRGVVHTGLAEKFSVVLPLPDMVLK